MLQFSKGYFRERWISDQLPDVTVRASFLLELIIKLLVISTAVFFHQRRLKDTS